MQIDDSVNALSIIDDTDLVALLEDDNLEESIFYLANQQIEKERKGYINRILSACPALAEIANGLKETEHLRIIFSDEVQAGLDSGIYKMMQAKDAAGVFKAVVVNQNGKIKAIPDVVIDKAMVGINPGQMATAMQGMAIQQQLQDITEQLEEMSLALNDVLAGQHNDRLAKYYAGASLYRESLCVSDEDLRRQLMNASVLMLSDAFSELSVSLKYDIDSLCSKYQEKSNSFKMKPDQLIREMVKINSSFEVIHKAVALKTAIYYKEQEYMACTTVLNEYGRLLQKTLNDEKTMMLYQADPRDKSYLGIWNARKEELPIKIAQVKEQLMNKANYCIEIKEAQVWNTNV